MNVLGWDIGGSNTKICRIVDGRVAAAISRPFEVKDAPDQLTPLLQELAAEAAEGTVIDAHAVTMTAELSRNFLTKQQGVIHVLETVRAAFPPPAPIYLFTVRGELVTVDDARCDAVSVASANWLATARLVADMFPDVLLIDIGSTTTDIVPIVAGKVANLGSTDLERLGTGELLYTGVLRTPVEAMAHEVTLYEVTYGVAAEGFATSGDVYVSLGDLMPEAYDGPTADGRPAEVRFAAERLRRALCADGDSMSVYRVHQFAKVLAQAQVTRIAASIERVRSRHPSLRRAVVAGLGGFVAERAARAAGLEVEPSADGRVSVASRCAPAAAVALLLERELEKGRVDKPRRRRPRPFIVEQQIERVVKVGGGLLAHPDAFEHVILRLGKGAPALVVPGGGPFADAVRTLDRRVAPSGISQHWMAVMAMDQYAEVLAGALGGERVETLAEARAALQANRLPVLAPFRWLRNADPLPCSWEVTSDSIAAWVAGQARARTLVLIKPPGATGQLTDSYFDRAIPPGVTVEIVPADDHERLDEAIGASPAAIDKRIAEILADDD